MRPETDRAFLSVETDSDEIVSVSSIPSFSLTA